MALRRVLVLSSAFHGIKKPLKKRTRNFSSSLSYYTSFKSVRPRRLFLYFNLWVICRKSEWGVVNVSNE